MPAWWRKVMRWLAGSASSPETPSPKDGSSVPVPAVPSPTPPPPVQTLPVPVRLASHENPFGVPLLDLRPVTLTMISTTPDPEAAARSVSWGRASGDDVNPDLPDAQVVRYSFRLPMEEEFPEGLMYAPSKMEQKWVIFHRKAAGQGRLVGVRSWTGITEFVIPFRREGGELVTDEVHVSSKSPLTALGPVGPLVEWIVRAHALNQRLPLPVDAGGFELLEQEPLLAFSCFGKVVLSAAVAWSPPVPAHPLRADGPVLRAVLASDVSLLRRLAALGEAVTVACIFQGYTPLHVALSRKDMVMVQALLELGADPNRPADVGLTPTHTAIVYRAPLEALDALVAAGACPGRANDRGFSPLHAVAEIDDPMALPWLMAQGLDLEARTEQGLTPLHIACGLGHANALKALLLAGADPIAESPMGSGWELAMREGHQSVVALLRDGAA